MRALIFVLLLLSPMFAVTQMEIKAVFLEKFTHLIKWEDVQPAELIICVLNHSEIADELTKVYNRLNNKSKIIQLKEGEDIPQCHILYIGDISKDITHVTNTIKNKPVLTVSDNDASSHDTVMINMFLEDNKFRYTINNKLAKESDIEINYLLLQSAKKVIK